MTVRRAPIARLMSGEQRLDAASSRYLHRVLRLEAGAPFIAFDPRARREADAQILRIDDGIVVASVALLRDASAVTRHVTLVQGLAKGDKCDAILRDATELGVTEILFVGTERSVVQLSEARATARLKRWEKIADEAARQSGRSSAPAISVSSWSEVVDRDESDAFRIVLDPHASGLLAPRLLELAESARPILFAIGPEGGFSSGELEKAEKQGWKRGRFGTTVLRTETAATAFLGALQGFADLFDEATDR